MIEGGLAPFAIADLRRKWLAQLKALRSVGFFEGDAFFF